MRPDNTDQIAAWNGDVGRRWTENQARLDAVIAPFGAAALAAAAVKRGEAVLDVGCGCGDTTLALADAVGPEGRVLGVDVSALMLARARERAGGRANIAWMEADASTDGLPGGHDVLYSRFGVMFFADPAGAFAALRRRLAPGGRLAFVCWRTLADNPWMTVPLRAGLAALGASPPPHDPLAPGPFAFADDARVRAILEGAGFSAVDVARFDSPLLLGASATEAAQMAAAVGPLASALRDHGGPAPLEAIAAALAAHAAPDGVRLGGSTWIVTARA